MDRKTNYALPFGLLVFHLAISGSIWWTGSNALFASDAPGALLIALGRLAGLLLASAILVQVVLIGRTVWLERTFGLDKLARVHHILGYSISALLVAHPGLIILGYGRLNGIGFAEQFLSIVGNSGHLLQAFLAFLVLLGLILIATPPVRRRLPYELWYFTHLLVYVAIALSFTHQLAGGDLAGRTWVLAYWYSLYVLVFGELVLFRLIRPVFLFYRHRFRVEEVRRETHDTVSIRISGRNLENFRFKPGQFSIFRFLAPGFWWQAHPFSLSQPFDGKNLRITVKGVGDYTRALPNVRPGTSVILDGPWGIFTPNRTEAPKLLLIAGGVGITPIRSAAEEFARAGREAVLLYANKTKEDIIFREELAELESKGPLKVHHVLSADDSWPGEKGRLDGERIKRLVPDVPDRAVFLCGPPPMMKAIRRTLMDLGVPAGRIFYERFAL